jgi:hypothetical protein
MVVDIKQTARWLGIALLAFAIWLLWWSRPERQVRRAQGRLLGALESRDYPALARLLAEDYRDAWDHDKANVLRRVPEVLDQFVLLDVEGEIRSVEPETATWVAREKIIVKGLGGALGMYARDEVNRLREPFTMHWRKRSWKPWDWELTRVEQPELRIPQDF